MKHEIFEKNSIILLIGILVVVSIGGIVQIAPLFWVESTIEKVKGMRPYTPLEQAGRDIYLREGCYGCHSQMIRTLRDEVERYGHYSLAAESMYDHPFQWGSKRTGPGPRPRRRQVLRPMAGRAPDQPARGRAGEHHAGLSLARRQQARHARHRGAAEDAEARRRPLHRRDDREGRSRILPRRSIPTAGRRASCCAATPRPRSRKFDGKPGAEPTELDALVAYLQMLGTLVDFATFDASGPNLR